VTSSETSKRAECPGEQRVARAQQEPRVRRVPPAEPLDQRRRADAGLAGHQHHMAAGGGRGQRATQLVQRRRAFEQVHNETLRLRERRHCRTTGWG
jgi:hypothetical protein